MMQITGHIAPENLMTLEAYARFRQAHKAEVIAHRRLRSVALGEHLMVQFESELTIRYQIQEMLRAEKLFEPADIQHEIEAYAPLVPDGRNWKATMLIAYADAQERQRALAQLMAIEDHMYVEVPGFARVYAAADEDWDRENAHKTSAVHFLRFEFSAEVIEALCQGVSAQLGCDHAHYDMAAVIPSASLRSLVTDFRG